MYKVASTLFHDALKIYGTSKLCTETTVKQNFLKVWWTQIYNIFFKSLYFHQCYCKFICKHIYNEIKTKKRATGKKVVIVFSGVLGDFEEKEPKCGTYVGAGGLVVSISTSALILSGNS